MSIALQFVLGKGWSSRAIAWWGQSYGGFSHVDAVLADGTLLGARSDAVGGQAPGVRIRPPDYEKWARRAVVTIPSTDAQAANWEGYLRTQVGDPYDKADILGLILGIPLMSAGHWICSALQFSALRVIGKAPPVPQIPQQIPPNMLYFGALLIGGSVST